MNFLSDYIMQTVAAGGGAALITFILLQYLGKKWLDDRFSNRLNELRHEQNKEVERLRIEIQTLLNGALRVQQNEFEIFPTLWEMINRAFGLVQESCAPKYRNFMISHLLDEEFNDLLNELTFTESERRLLEKSANKDDLFTHLLVKSQISESFAGVNDLCKYVAKHQILIPENINSEVVKFANSLSELQEKIKINQENKHYAGVDMNYQQAINLRKSMVEIGDMMQKRLTSHAL
jgi:hypothetical protein